MTTLSSILILPHNIFRMSLVATNIAVVLLLTGCGSGGGGGGDKGEVVVQKPSTRTKVGIIDSGLAPGRSQFNYNTVHFASFVGGGNQPNDNQGVDGHGTVVALMAAGLATQGFSGGVAPDSELYIAQASQPETGSSFEFNYADTTRAVQWLLGENVKIINMSYASAGHLVTPEDLLNARGSYQALHSQLQEIVNANALSIVATGNDGSSTPSPNVLVPLIYNEPELQKGILAVTGYLTENPIVDGVAKEEDINAFNYCGNAAAYCMSTRGYAEFPGDADGDGVYTDDYWYGTSFAAPKVTGAAARVEAIFPWMTGYNLQQTLLTTSTYLTDAYNKYIPEKSKYVTKADGTVVFIPYYEYIADSSNGHPYNNRFGWGDLNIEKAMKGPAMFYADNFTANLSAGEYTFSNDISGDYGLIVAGVENAGGVLRLTGQNTYKGDTIVSANSLFVDGKITGNTGVSGSGLLAGKGFIGGNVVNDGTVATTTEGALTIEGNYKQTNKGTLSISLSHPLTVDGSSEISGALQVGLPGDSYIVKKEELLLHSAQGVSGVFSKINTGPFLSGNVTYSTNDITGEFSRVNTTDAVVQNGLQGSVIYQTAANVESALQVADRWASESSPTGQQSSLLAKAAAFEHLTTASASSALESLSGQAHATSNVILFNSLDYQNQLLNNRLEQSDNKKNYGLWLETGQLHGDLNQSGYLGSHYNINLTAIGVDTNLNIPDFRIGIAYTDTQIKADYAGSGGISQNKLHGIMSYIRYQLSPNWYMQGNLSYQHGQDSLQRTILLDNVQPVSARTSSDSWQGLVKTGYILAMDNVFSVQPYAGTKFSYLSTGKFTDSGSEFGLTGSGDTYSRFVGFSGLNLRARLQWNKGWWSTFSVNGEYEYAFTNPSLDISARWSGLGQEGIPLNIPGMSLDRDSLWTGAKLDMGNAEDFRLFLRVDKHFTARGNEDVFRGGLDIFF